MEDFCIFVDMAYSIDERERILKEVFNLIEDGSSLRKSLIKVSISSKTFYEWIEANDDKVKQYARACEKRADNIFEDIMTICDATEDDIIVDENGNFITNHNVIQRDRLRVDARKWMLGKMNPKKYGDKIHQEHSGELNITDMSPEQRQKRIEALKQKIQ